MKINRNNYEEWMVAFLDNELSVEELAVFEKFLEHNPALKMELAAYEAINFGSDEQIIFDKKDILYKKSPVFLLIKKTWPVAAAIVILLALLPFIHQDEQVTQNKIVRNPTLEKNKNTDVLDTVNSAISTVAVSPEQDVSKPTKEDKPKTKKESVVASVQEKARTKEHINEARNRDEIDKPKNPNHQPAVVAKTNTDKNMTEPVKVIEKEIVQAQDNRQNELSAENPEEKNIQEGKSKAIVFVSTKDHPFIQNKLDEVAAKVETNIEKIKEIKDATIVVSIGNRKLFSINN